MCRPLCLVKTLEFQNQQLAGKRMDICLVLTRTRIYTGERFYFHCGFKVFRHFGTLKIKPFLNVILYNQQSQWSDYLRRNISMAFIFFFFLFRLLSSGSLVIISPTVDDTAVYECSVSNDAGEDQRAVELTVQGRGDIAITSIWHPGFLRGIPMLRSDFYIVLFSSIPKKYKLFPRNHEKEQITFTLILIFSAPIHSG